MKYKILQDSLTDNFIIARKTLHSWRMKYFSQGTGYSKDTWEYNIELATRFPSISKAERFIIDNFKPKIRHLSFIKEVDV